jgi:hypothetical protein
MRIAIIGSGNIGSTLGAKWAAAGHEIVFGVRDPASDKARKAAASVAAGATLTTPMHALASGEVVLLAIPGDAVAATLADAGAALDGKIVIDATNRFGSPVVNNLAVIAAAAPGAILYRAFNSLGWESFAEPVIDGVQVDLLYCGPDGPTRSVVEQLIAAVGLRPVWIGDQQYVTAVDAVGQIWIALAFGQGMGRRLAFKVLT